MRQMQSRDCMNKILLVRYRRSYGVSELIKDAFLAAFVFFSGHGILNVLSSANEINYNMLVRSMLVHVLILNK